MQILFFNAKSKAFWSQLQSQLVPTVAVRYVITSSLPVATAVVAVTESIKNIIIL